MCHGLQAAGALSVDGAQRYCVRDASANLAHPTREGSGSRLQHIANADLGVVVSTDVRYRMVGVNDDDNDGGKIWT